MAKLQRFSGRTVVDPDVRGMLGREAVLVFTGLQAPMERPDIDRSVKHLERCQHRLAINDFESLHLTGIHNQPINVFLRPSKKAEEKKNKPHCWIYEDVVLLMN